MRTKMIITIIIICIFSIIIPLKSVCAGSVGEIFTKADEFLANGDSAGSVINEGQLKETSNFLYKTLLAIGIVVMFLVGTIIGIQFMLASAEDKAKVKEALIPYIVGCAVILGAFTIWSIAVNLGQKTVPTSYTQKDAGDSESDSRTLRICG